MNLKTIYACAAATLAALAFAACTDKWEEEQYYQYVSFKAPESSSSTVTRIRVKYKDGPVTYRLPLIVSGTMMNNRDLDVHVALDRDTLRDYNLTVFGDTRQDLWYRELDESRYSFPAVTRIPKGECTALVDIQFDFRGVDFSENWMLPLVVQDDPSYGYQSHPKLGFNNALLWLTPFNDYSGIYQTTALSVYADNSGQGITVSTREARVVDENSVFFYAGCTDDGRLDRRDYKIKATFHPDENFVKEEGSDVVMRGTVTLEAMNPTSDLAFTLNSSPTFVTTEIMDTERPVLMRRTTTIQNIDYSFYDTHESTAPIFYTVSGSMSLQRNINITIPDEEYAIEWDD